MTTPASRSRVNLARQPLRNHNRHAMSIDSQAYTVYYKRLLPFKSLFAWLNHQHAPTRLFTHREWAFTVAGDVYLRWNSFNTADEFKKEVLRLNPSRFEIGAVYTGKVRVPILLLPGKSCADSCDCSLYALYFNFSRVKMSSRKTRRLFSRPTLHPHSVNWYSILI